MLLHYWALADIKLRYSINKLNLEPTMTTNSSPHDWQVGEKSGLVNVNGRSLFLRGSGPKRQTPTTPAIIIEHGLGGSTSEWVVVIRTISRLTRVYTYERAGYYPSDPPVQPPTPAVIAADLRSLLSAANISPPFILVGHSYGGVLIRQFLVDSDPGIVAGMVIVDSAPEVTKVPESWTTLLGDSTYEDVVGLSTNHCLTAGEWQAVKDDGQRNEGNGSIAEKEFKLQPENNAALRKKTKGKQLLGSAPLSVVFCDESNDFGKVYEYGVKHHFGTLAAQEALRKRLEDMSEVDEAAMREHLSLSSNSRFVKAQGKAKTHNSHFIMPELVVGEIEWVYRQHQTSQN